MSIRLRLTLLYSAIVALTLVAFSIILYLVEAQATLETIQTALVRQADLFSKGPRRSPDHPDEPPRPLLPSGGVLPGRWTQTRNAEGAVVARTADLGDTTLPLSEAGLRAVLAGVAWSEVAYVEDEPLLIYTQPISAQSRIVEIVQFAAPMTERAQALNTLRLVLVIGSGLASLAAFGIGWVLAGAALSPIQRITQTAQAIGAEHNLHRRVQHAGPNDEVGQLATTFNTMLNELESAYRQLEQALESQRRFVADASHELRTPLTTVRGNIELLRHEPPLDTQEQREILADTTAEVERLIRLVHQLLLLARMDAQRELPREPVPLKPLLDDVCRQTKLLAPTKTLVSETMIDGDVLANRDALKQVLLILLDNARTHTPPEAAIHVTSEVNAGYLLIHVRDTGAGIAPQALSHIFERFYREDAARTGSGAGLGLAIAKELIEAQDGALTVDSRVGQGSVFTVKLPQATR